MADSGHDSTHQALDAAVIDALGVGSETVARVRNALAAEPSGSSPPKSWRVSVTVCPQGKRPMAVANWSLSPGQLAVGLSLGQLLGYDGERIAELAVAELLA